MRCALDTNVLARSIQTDHPHQVVALAAITKLIKQADEVHILPQNLVEFWVLSTRPTKDNGLGLSPSEAEAHIAKFESLFPIYADNAAVYANWRKLVTEHEVKGKNAHDARIAAALMAHGITHLLTFNKDDFKRFSKIKALSPSEI